MWVIGFIAMALKYAEALLGVYTRQKDENGQWRGGANIYLAKIWKPLGWIWAVSCCFGMGIGCGKAGIEKPDFGRVTRHGNHLYFHVYENTVGPLPLPGVKKEEIQAIRYVATGAEIPVSTSWVHSDYPTMAFADLGEDPVLPDGVDTVIDVILKK